jgi:hypothetical protein
MHATVQAIMPSSPTAAGRGSTTEHRTVEAAIAAYLVRMCVDGWLHVLRTHVLLDLLAWAWGLG